MTELGLRERKKRRTREAITDAAFALFQESGFDGVSVVDIADAAEVSKPTLFAYFPTKEDLVLRRFLDHTGPALVVRQRPSGETVLRALRRDFLDRLAQRDVLTGLNDTPEAMTFHSLLYSTTTVMARLTGYMLDRERELAVELVSSEALSDEFTARTVAAQVFSAQRILGDHNAHDIRAGHTADETYPAAVTRTETAFDLLESGLAPHIR